MLSFLLSMSIDVIGLFDTLTGEEVPRHLPLGGVVYKFSWVNDLKTDDWKADGYRWRNMGAAKKIRKYDAVGMKKTFYHVNLISISSK